MIRFACLLLLLFAGCVKAEPRVVALPAPPPTVPTVNPPLELRWHNWTSVGSCVYAAFINVMECHNRHDIAVFVRQNYAGPAGPHEIIAACKRLHIEHDTTYLADPGFLDWADRNGYGAIIWWKPKHCCSFHGWVNRNGRICAAILDNNFEHRWEFVERQEFIQRWAGYGGFALAPMCDLATVVPYNAYELSYD